MSFRQPLLRVCDVLVRSVGLSLCAVLAWFSVLSVEALSSGDAAQRGAGAAVYLLRLSVDYTLHLLPLGIAAQLSRWLLARVVAKPTLLTAALVAAPSIGASLEQATLLTSGGQISDVAEAPVLRVALAAAFVLVCFVLALYHLALVQPARGTKRSPRALLALLAVGAGVLAVAVELIDERLRQYLFFGMAALPLIFFLAATLPAALLSRAPFRVVLVVTAALGLGLASALSLPASRRELRRAETAFVSTGAAASLTDLSLHPTRTAPAANIVLPRGARARCAQPPAQPAGPPAKRAKSPPNVILLSVDALRRDALQASANGKHAMPALRAFARQSLVFERATTTYPATLFALGSALTGYYPSELLYAPRRPPSLFALAAETFAARFISLPDNAWFKKAIARKLFWKDAPVALGRTARAQTDALLAALESARAKRQNVLAWVHYYEPHGTRAATTDQNGLFDFLVRTSLRDHHAAVPGYAFGDDTRGRYLSEVAYVDAQLGRVLRYLDEKLPDALVIVFADHGEALGERGYHGHHVYLSSFLSDVPLLVRAPSRRAAVRDDPASVRDVAGTVLAFAGLSAPTDARDLLAGDSRRYEFAEAFPVRGAELYALARKPTRTLAALRERLSRTRRFDTEYLPKVSVVSSRYRLIVNRATGARELYDRERDPAELLDLAGTDLPVERELAAALAAWNRELSTRIYCRVARNGGQR